MILEFLCSARVNPLFFPFGSRARAAASEGPFSVCRNSTPNCFRHDPVAFFMAYATLLYYLYVHSVCYTGYVCIYYSICFLSLLFSLSCLPRFFLLYPADFQPDGSQPGPAQDFSLIKGRCSGHRADLGVPALGFCLSKALTDYFKNKNRIELIDHYSGRSS